MMKPLLFGLALALMGGAATAQHRRRRSSSSSSPPPPPVALGLYDCQVSLSLGPGCEDGTEISCFDGAMGLIPMSYVMEDEIKEACDQICAATKCNFFTGESTCVSVGRGPASISAQTLCTPWVMYVTGERRTRAACCIIPPAHCLCREPMSLRFCR